MNPMLYILLAALAALQAISLFVLNDLVRRIERLEAKLIFGGRPQ